MKYINNTEITQKKPSVVALGNFDGLHKGHKKLIQELQRQGNRLQAQEVIFSFFPHPAFVLGNRKDFQLIYTKDEKIRKMKKLGIHLYIEYPFTKQIAELDPRAFIEQVLYKQLQAKAIVIGENFRFGRNRKGNVDLLISVGKNLGFEVFGMPIVQFQEEDVNSTLIRQYLKEGKMVEANELLGEPYSIMGIVATGKQIGRTLGFPTANLIPPADKLLPTPGVYITEVLWNGKSWPSITNVGSNPTVSGSSPTVESYLLDFHENLYEKWIEVRFLDYLRPEVKFVSIADLKKAIKQDEQKARIYFEY